MENRTLDLIVIGAGPGGYVAAIKGAKEGLSVAVVENRRAGGTCLNRGCIPTKAMIHAAGLYREAREGGRFGIHADNVSFDYGEIVAYRQETVDGLVGGVEQLLKANGVKLIEGTGTLLAARDGKNRVRVRPVLEEASDGGDAGGSECSANDSGDSAIDSGSIEPGASGDAGECILTADNVILATGSKPARLPIPGMDLPGVIDSDGLFALDHAPKSLVIIGGGVIGVEFATAFSALGTEVTILEALPKILDNFDKEISQNLKMILKKRGVDIHTGAMVEGISDGAAGGQGADESAVSAGGQSSDEAAAGAGGSTLICSYMEKDKPQRAEGEYILCAAGRSPVTEGLFGEDVSLEMNGRFVRVDEDFATGMPGVYAIGDLTGGIQLAHAASAHGIRVIEAITGKVEHAQQIGLIPGCVYTEPEIATVGITEAQAKEQGIEADCGKFIMSANGRSMITKEERGFIKVVVEKDSGRILGAQMMCARATDMIGEFTTAIAGGLTAEDMLRGVRAHPTYNEGVAEALEDAVGESLHTVPRRGRR